MNVGDHVAFRHPGRIGGRAVAGLVVAVYPGIATVGVAYLDGDPADPQRHYADVPAALVRPLPPCAAAGSRTGA